MQTPGEFVREQVTTVRSTVDRVAGSVAETVASSVGDTPSVAAVSSSVGDFIREQRSAARVSLRELARTAGVSNPYLSQVERGLRKPSAEILAQIARGLKISAETLYETYVREHARDEDRHPATAAPAAPTARTTTPTTQEETA